jgi:hypothetical protein
MFKRSKSSLRRFFYPPAGSPRWMFLLPYVVLAILGIMLLVGGMYGWDYTNSPGFCGTTCHTMPPQNATYLASPHSNVYCTECHIGRSFLGEQVARKTEDVREVISMVFHTYEFPIQASRSRPALQTCEKCHQPEAFSGDRLLVVNHFQEDQNNTPFSYYLIMKTGGGAKRQGLGRGIHWHIVNKVVYYSPDPLNQEIPYIRVYNNDGTTTEYVDAEANFDPTTIDENQLKPMDCITCHNRVSHNFLSPTEAVEDAMAQRIIDPTIPEIRKKGVEILSVTYTSQEEAMTAIASLEEDYKNNLSEYYYDNSDQVEAAIKALQDIYNQNVFVDQKVDWTTHPNNLGHINSPGCFRCHDGKHLDSQQQAVRLECNLCHSIPVVATQQDFVTRLEIGRGQEPTSHFNPNWISLHNIVFDGTCSNCHTTENAGGTTNTSFCSNSACHGSVFTYAGFNAPALRQILQAQLPPAPTPAATLAPVSNPTFEDDILPIFSARCVACHNTATHTAGLDLSTYTGVLTGGQDGAIIIPGDSANSLLIKIQSAVHFANVSQNELTSLINWITTGAPEK